MIKFKSLFSFSRTEIQNLFPVAKHKANINGFKLLQIAPQDIILSETISSEKPIATTKNITPEHGKILIITSRKTGKAHDRNLIRRRIKEIFYKHQLYQKPVISILIVYNSALKLTYEQITDFLTQNI